ncbi:hypothetical protein CLOSTASPAR_03400 [[Clostridium] asparagiforme DSM 15981]|uniref:Uncharacterized protein n=1 Tax=[Clostridium] asparagiforme DSM 15981 TaxID=518636 RepID=C0D2B1_9FIRM|nr:hypothetical protein CLOSTASPAR_03400 [[Clostridium] asparagiforme DSM 15981]
MEFPGNHLFTKKWKSVMLSITLFIYMNNGEAPQKYRLEVGYIL